MYQFQASPGGKLLKSKPELDISIKRWRRQNYQVVKSLQNIKFNVCRMASVVSPILRCPKRDTWKCFTTLPIGWSSPKIVRRGLGILQFHLTTNNSSIAMPRKFRADGFQPWVLPMPCQFWRAPLKQVAIRNISTVIYNFESSFTLVIFPCQKNWLC